MRVLFVLLMCSAAICTQAQSIHIFKEVHADGTVIYSDTRPTNSEAVEKMKIHQESAAIAQQGQQRQQEIEAAAKTLEEQRADEAKAKREYRKRVAEAQDEVVNAERALVTAEQSKKYATPERIAAAREHLRLARQRLREVQSAGP